MSQATGTRDIQAAMLAKAVPLDATVFPMGCELESVQRATRAHAEKRNLSLGSLLAPTPPRWVRMPAFRIGRSLVTNGEYRDFLRATTGQTPGERAIYDDPELWRYIWRGLGYRVEQQRAWLVRSDGPAASQEERYDQCDTFIEAYIQSLRYETGRILAGPSAALEPVLSPSGEDVVRVHGEEGTTFAVLKRDPLVDKVFGALAGRLAVAGARGAAAARSRRAPAGPVDLDEIDQLAGRLSERMSAAVAAQPQLFARPGLEPEPHLFLTRCRDALEGDPNRPLKLHEVVYPRSWTYWEGEPPPLFAGPDVPWEDRPVLGVSIYEAVAFVLWLSQAAPAGEKCMLPTEAEFERAAGWPDDAADPGEPAGPPVDPTLKDIYPWQRSAPERDFREFFGGESKELAHYFTNRVEYDRLVQATARATSKSDRIEMLIGFAWQWTADRFDEEERAYSRFADGTCRNVFERPRRDHATSERKTEPVYDYAPTSAVTKHGSFVVRGAPDLVGGEGLTTRRFALNPLRGCHNVGFRWIVRKG